MKKGWRMGVFALALALAMVAVDLFDVPLPDWAARLADAAILLALAAMAYSVIKGGMEK